MDIDIQKDDLIEHDPGKRRKVTTDNDRNYLISLGPCQPTLSIFPTNEGIHVSKQRRFNSGWYSEFPLLEYSVNKNAAFCLKKLGR